MSLAETADKTPGPDRSAPSSATSAPANSGSVEVTKPCSVISPSNTPKNNSGHKRSAAEANDESNIDEALLTPKESKSSEESGKHVDVDSSSSDKDSKTNTGGNPIAPSSSTVAETPAASDGSKKANVLTPWYSPNPSQPGYRYPPPHPHMGMNMGMYPPPSYPPPYPYMTPGMYYPHSPYPPPHVTPNGSHPPPHMFPPHPYGYHNPVSTPTVATPKPVSSPNQGDENSISSTPNANSKGKMSDDDAQENDSEASNAKRVKTESVASESDSNVQAPNVTPHHPQTPQPVMPVPPPPHYYPYYPPHPHAHAHPHVHPHAHPHGHPHLPHPHPHAPPPHGPPSGYYPPPQQHPQEDNSKKGESLNRCERISIPKGSSNNSPKQSSKLSSIAATPTKPKPEFKMPSFQSLVNFPSSIIRRMKAASELRCVMCGELRSSSAKKGENGQNSHAQQHHIIPKQNKGLCTGCDVAVWMIKSEQVEIKWCKGCKNFRIWTDFGEKLGATKCGRCREKQKEKYAQKVGRFDVGSAKKDKNGGIGDEDARQKVQSKSSSSSLKGGDSGLSFLIAATNQVSKH